MKRSSQLPLIPVPIRYWQNWPRSLTILSISLAFWAFSPFIIFPAGASPQLSGELTYEFRQFHNPDGIGKFYLGREIAKVMGHQEALWLERPSRESEEKPEKLMNALHLKSTDQVADIGAGTGYFSFRMAQLLPQGTVFAVDIQPEMVDILNFLKQENAIKNVQPVLGNEQSPNLPHDSLDLALMVDAYHEFSYPKEMMENLRMALKPQGKVVLVEYRAENPLIAIKGVHKMSQRQVKKEMAAVGLRWLETQEILPQQHIMIFQRM